MLRFVTFVGLAVLAVSNGVNGACQVSNQRTYTTQDASVLTSIAYITEFQLTCDGKPVVGTQLHAVCSEGGVLQVGENKGNYQVSWTEELASATKGDHALRVFDDEGISQVRKAQKTGASIENIAPLASVTLNHPGAYTGPWLNSEHLAAIMGVVVVYVAITSKSKLLA